MDVLNLSVEERNAWRQGFAVGAIQRAAAAVVRVESQVAAYSDPTTVQPIGPIESLE
jgi:hypothetical protein